MLRTRVITASVLLAVLSVLLMVNLQPVIAVAACLILTAAMWEALRLFKIKNAVVSALAWSALFAAIAFIDAFGQVQLLMPLCVLIWALRLAPSLKFGLPALGTAANSLLGGVYCLTILGCFVAMLALFSYSALYLFSVLALVWVADIGAYFSGKAFGQRKLAPSISPGKSWEGAIGGWFAVVTLSAICTQIPVLHGTFAVQLQLNRGWLVLFLALSVLVAASVVGDLFESQLKRRAGVKDSSTLLPGHGGVLDRIDALIPVLPLALLLHTWR
ncbi:MAG: phosphatidate cytidylyltransferase [Pseudomonadota bacterium]